MPEFSKVSKERLSGCHPDLITLMNSAIDDYDFTIICGYRSQKDQDKAYNEGKSKLKYPDSKHNLIPSMAVDIAPVKYFDNGGVWIDWDDLQSFFDLHEVIKSHAKELGIKIRWGGDWDGNPLTRNKFNDFPHYELIEV